MRLNHGVEAKKWFVFVGFNEVQRLILNQVRSVLLRFCTKVAPQHVTTIIVPQKVWVIVVRLPLAVVAIKAIEAHLEWLTDTTRRAKAPLTEQTCCVASFLQYMCHGFGIRRHWLLAFRHKFRISAYDGMANMLSCHQCATRRCTYGASRIVTSKLHTLLRQGINVRCFKMRLAVTTQIAIPEIVCQDVDHIRVLSCLN